MTTEVKLSINIFSGFVLEFGGEDAVNECDILGALAECLGAEFEITVNVSEELVKVDGRRNPSFAIGFSALGGENTLLDGDFAESVGERHCEVLYNLVSCRKCHVDRKLAYVGWLRVGL